MKKKDPTFTLMRAPETIGSPKEDQRWITEYEKYVKAFRKTKAFRKLQNYFEEIIKTPKAKEKIIDFRKRLGLPVTGIKVFDQGNKDISDFNTADRLLSQLVNETNEKGIGKEINDWIDGLGFESLLWRETFLVFIMHNIVDEPPFNLLNSQCQFHVIEYETEEVEAFFEEHGQDFNKTSFARHNRIFPLVIQFTPYTTQNELIEFIKFIYKAEIEPAQKERRSKLVSIGKYRNRLTRERDNFIGEHPDLKRREIQKLVKNKFKVTISLKHISVIRRRERQKDNTK